MSFNALPEANDDRWANRTLFISELDDPKEYDRMNDLLKEYTSAVEIAKEFAVLDQYMLAEISNLENQIKPLVLTAKQTIFKITFEDDEHMQNHHPRWQNMSEADLKEWSAERKKELHQVAKDDIHFLRSELVQLQRLVYGSCRAVERGESLNALTYPKKMRPADRVTPSEAKGGQ